MFIVTGGGSGIGKTLALALAKRGKTVLIVGRREHLLQETAAQSPLINYLCADVSTDEGMHSVKSMLKDTAHIEALVNNAGTLDPMVSLKEVQRDAWQQAYRTNVEAPLFLSQLLQDKLSNGRVLNIGTGAAYFAVQGWAAYCSSKAALALLTQCCQLEFPDIAFTSVKPGIIDTEMQTIIRKGSNMNPDDTARYHRLKDNNRLISPETTAEFLVWLLLDTDQNTFTSKEWDIYDTDHHVEWLKPPHQVLHWDF